MSLDRVVRGAAWMAVGGLLGRRLGVAGRVAAEAVSEACGDVAGELLELALAGQLANRDREDA